MATREDMYSYEIEVIPTLSITSELSHFHSSKQPSVASLKCRDSNLKVNWKPKCDLVWMKNKGTFIVLLWSFFSVSVLHYMMTPDGKLLTKKIYHARYVLTIPMALSTVLYPIAGWLADIYIGRYKTIRASLWIMWVGSIMYVGCRITAEFDSDAKNILEYFYVLFFVLFAFGLGGFEANIIQFGIDQLLDASTDDIVAFVSWYAGTAFGGGVLIYILEYVPKEYHILQPLLLAINLSLALCVDFLFSSKWLIKEPVTQNPFKLVRKVIAYAIKNKHPRMRSAFTYWEDKLPSRIDLAKVKYGGPFTSEQVEDVKTFFRMLAMIVLGTIGTGATFMANHTLNILSTQLFNSTPNFYDSKYSTNWYKIFRINHLTTYSAMFWVLLYQLVIHPLFHKCLPNITTLSKVTIGVFLELIHIISVMTLNQIGRHNASHENVTLQCILVTNPPNLNIDYYWFAIPELLFSLSLLVSIIGGLEFICAQSPYSMKGLLIGSIYGMVGVLSLFELLIIYMPFKLTAKYWKESVFNCGFWMLTVEVILVTITFILFCVMRKRYKRRQREDVLPNEQIFANQYYSQLTTER